VAKLRHILLPQGLANAWQPIIGQYLNLMKLSSLASGIGFAELTYQAANESYNAPRWRRLPSARRCIWRLGW
jgi:polar amino acid transport system permease protein